MKSQNSGPLRLNNLLLILVFLLMVSLQIVNSEQVYAEGNEPTNTPIPTSTVTATITLVPTDTQVPMGDNLDNESPQQPVVTIEDNASAPPSGNYQTEPKSITQSLGGTNLCLIGAIVLGMMVVMVMVVYGVMQRIRTEE
jgi:hypothetical protein